MKKVNLLAIETSCDDTSAAVLQNNIVLSNIIANQTVHHKYGGVVPELASRAHIKNIIPVINDALQSAKIQINKLHTIAYTRGPGLMGSLMVGVSFAKSLSLALNIPSIETDHLDAHIFSIFLDKKEQIYHKPDFPFLALLISGGHTKIGIVNDYLDVRYIGDTIDDAAGEAFDKAAKIIGLPYPGGPHIDKLARTGDANRFKFSKPKISDFDFSFSGLKTSFLYFIRDEMQKDMKFIDKNINDLCASIQHIIVEILLEKMKSTVVKTGCKNIVVVGGVSANTYLKKIFLKWSNEENIKMFFPEPCFATDNAAMIGMIGYLKYQKKMFAPLDALPYSIK